MRQRVLEEPLVQRSVHIYLTEWDELGTMLSQDGSNMSFFLRNVVKLELRKRKRKCGRKQSCLV